VGGSIRSTRMVAGIFHGSRIYPDVDNKRWQDS
jgi:hypothetical protein